MVFTKMWEMQGLGKESTPAAVSDTSFYSCNTAACSNTEGAALFTKKGREAYVSLQHFPVTAGRHCPPAQARGRAVARGCVARARARLGSAPASLAACRRAPPPHPPMAKAALQLTRVLARRQRQRQGHHRPRHAGLQRQVRALPECVFASSLRASNWCLPPTHSFGKGQ